MRVLESETASVTSNPRAHVTSGRSDWPELAVIGLVIALAIYRFSATVVDPDLGGHLKFGQVVWETGRIAQPDPFSYVTGGDVWVNHEWLAEVIWYLAFAVGGPAALIGLKVGLAVLVSALVCWHLLRQGVTRLRTAVVVLLMLHFFLITLITVRPLILSYLLFLLVLLLIQEMANGRIRLVWTIPLLFVLWANLHPGFLAGLAVLGIWSAVELGIRRFKKSATSLPSAPSDLAILGVFIAGVLATAINPYGIHLWGFLYRTATVPRPDITEWQPIVLVTQYGFTYFLFLALAVWGTSCSRRPRQPALLAVLICTGLLPFVAIRHTPIAALGIAVLAGPHMADAWERWSHGRRSSKAAGNPNLRRWFGGAALAGSVLVIALSAPNFSCIRIIPTIGGAYPARAIALIKQSDVHANLAIDFDWGLYAIYHLGPAVKVSLDGRRETMYRPAVYGESLQFMHGQGDWDALLRRHETDLALVRNGSPAFNLMKLRPGWNLIYEDPVAGLFGREGHATVDQVRRTPVPALRYDGAGLCLR